jgi:hypothetical protein
MSCIALTGLQKNRLMSHLFLASIQAGDPVECSGFDKLISQWIKPLIDAVTNYFFAVKLGSTLFPDYIVNEILDKQVNVIKTDLLHFAEYTGVVTKSFRELNRDERGWTWVEGFHWFLNHNFVQNNKYLYKTNNGTGYTVNDLDYMLKNHKFHPYQLNFIGWVKAYHAGLMSHAVYANKNVKDVFNSGIKFYCPNVLQNQQRWSQKDTWMYINNYIIPAADWIADLNMEALKPKNTIPESKDKGSGEILPGGTNLKAVAALAAAGLIIGKLK